MNQYLLTSDTGKLIIRSNEREMPKESDYRLSVSDLSHKAIVTEWDIRKGVIKKYHEALKQWLSTCVNTEVHPESVEKFKKIGLKYWEAYTGIYEENMTDKEWITYREFLKEGILLPSGSVLIEKKAKGAKTTLGSGELYETYFESCAHYLDATPLVEEQKETQEELWKELLSDLKSVRNDETTLLKDIKSKYSIMRNNLKTE